MGQRESLATNPSFRHRQKIDANKIILLFMLLIRKSFMMMFVTSPSVIQTILPAYPIRTVSTPTGNTV